MSSLLLLASYSLKLFFYLSCPLFSLSVAKYTLISYIDMFMCLLTFVNRRIDVSFENLHQYFITLEYE